MFCHLDIHKTYSYSYPKSRETSCTINIHLFSKKNEWVCSSTATHPLPELRQPLSNELY